MSAEQVDRMQRGTDSEGAAITTASRLKCMTVLARTAAVTLAVTAPTIVEARLGRYDRSVADRRLRHWANSLLGQARVLPSVSNPHGVELPMNRPVVIMSNHASLYDIPLIFSTLGGSIRMLTKKELFRVPVWGKGMAVAEFVSVDRSDHNRAVRDLEYAEKKLADGIALWVSPEGTRSKTGELGRLKKGGFVLAIETGALIVPVGIRGADKVLPPGSFFDLHLNCPVEVHIGQPIDASAFSFDARDRLLEKVGDRIAALAGVEWPNRPLP